MDGEERTERADPARGRSKRKAVLVAGGLLVVMLLSTGCYCLGLVPVGRRSGGGTEAARTALPILPSYVETPEMIVNLDAGPHRIAFAKVQYRIEVERPLDAQALTAAMPRVVDMAQTYLRAVRPEELRSDTGSYLLREALLDRLSVALPNVAVSDILFEELLVQ